MHARISPLLRLVTDIWPVCFETLYPSGGITFILNRPVRDGRGVVVGGRQAQPPPSATTCRHLLPAFCAAAVLWWAEA